MYFRSEAWWKYELHNETKYERENAFTPEKTLELERIEQYGTPILTDTH